MDGLDDLFDAQAVDADTVAADGSPELAATPQLRSSFTQWDLHDLHHVAGVRRCVTPPSFERPGPRFVVLVDPVGSHDDDVDVALGDCLAACE